MRRTRTLRVVFRNACRSGAARAAQCRFEGRRETRPSGLDKRFQPRQSLADEIVSVKLITPRSYAIRHDFASKKPWRASLSQLARKSATERRGMCAWLCASSRAARLTRMRSRRLSAMSLSVSRPLVPESCDHACKAARELTHAPPRAGTSFMTATGMWLDFS